MTDAFENWINGMTDQEYEDWLEDDASPAQEEKALNIRTPPTEQDQDDVDALQEYEDNEASRERQQIEQEEERERERIRASRVQDVYDNRDLPPEREYAIIERSASNNQPIRVTPIKDINEPILQPRELPQQPIQQPSIPSTPVRNQPRPPIRQPSRIRAFFSRINPLRFFRRNK